MRNFILVQNLLSYQNEIMQIGLAYSVFSKIFLRLFIHNLIHVFNYS